MSMRPLLFAFAALEAQAAILLEPRHCVLQAGQTVTFKVRTPDGRPAPCAFSVQGAGGRIGPDGVFTGPPGEYRVRASSTADPADLDETGVLVLPDHAGLRTVAAVCPEVFEPGWSEGPPFKDIETGRRFGDPGARVEEIRGGAFTNLQIIGYGLPVPLRFPPEGLVAGAQLLSWMEGDQARRLDVTGARGAAMEARTAVTGAQVEFLNQWSRNVFTSRIHPLDVLVRGMLPLAGHPVAGPGDADGRGLAARFRQPDGLAILPGGALAVADPEAHVLRLVRPGGAVTTLLGLPGQPGHAEGGPGTCRFRAPTFLAALPSGSLVVADTGNHVIRRVDAGDQTATLAGVPGTRGHKDAADPRLALFDEPQGLAVAPDGTVFAADRGNHVIRKIAPSGMVTTLAGVPGGPGHVDGPAATARFSALRGLALGPDGVLYAVDGHSVRRLAHGAVTTLCGDPRRPGPSCQGLARAGAPCLENPHGLALLGRDVLVTDRGNRTLLALAFNPAGGTEVTLLAGDRHLAGTRFGLLRYGLPRLPAGDFAALADPRGVAVDAQGDAFVSDGTCLVRCSALASPRSRPVTLLLPGAAARCGSPLKVDFLGPGWDKRAHFFWTLEALDPVGSPVVPPQTGVQRGLNLCRTMLTLPASGKVDLCLTCVSADGVPSQVHMVLEVD